MQSNFTSSPSSVDQRKRRINQITGGLCIFLFILSLAFPIHIIIRTIKTPDNTIVKKNITTHILKTNTIQNPTFITYSQLHMEYPHTLKCPCGQTSINYNKFLNIQLQFHPICSSSFVSQSWIDSLRNNTFTGFVDDFRMISPYLFQALNTLCTFSKMTTDYDLTQFFNEKFHSKNVVPPTLLQSEMNSRIQELNHAMIEKFQLSFQMIQNLIETNALFSGLQTNYQLSVQNDAIISSSVSYNGCNCSSSSKCTKESVIYDLSNGNILYRVPGFRTGCYIIESLLQSDLRCLFDQSCLDELQSYLLLPQNTKTLHPLPSTSFFDSTPIHVILNQLMLVERQTSMSYNAYYEHCQPEECIYATVAPETTEIIEIIPRKIDVAYLIALIIGILGGTISILQLIIPRLVKLVIKGT